MVLESTLVIKVQEEVIMLKFKMKTWDFSELNVHQTQAIQQMSTAELSMGLSTGSHELV